MYKNNQKGFIASLNTILVLIFMLSLAMSISVLISTRQKITTNTVSSTQAYYTAQAGIEDSLIRLKNNPQMSALTYSLAVNNTTASVVIPSSVGESRTISSQGNNNGLIKTLQVVYSVDSEHVSFYYAVRVGQGGLIMNGSSRIMGNVFSDGNISGSGTIDNDAIVSGNGHSISGVYVGQDVFAYSCLSGASVANLTYVTGGSHTCTVRPGGATTVQGAEIDQQPLPISNSQIDSWKQEASVATCSSTAVDNIGKNNETVSMGPCKVNGNLKFGNSTMLTLTGTIYVTGDIILGNTDIIKLDSSYNSLGGIIILDGVTDIKNGNTFSGSGQPKSYLMFLSTNTSDSAITVHNGSTGAVFYTNAGGILLKNGVSVLELTGYKVTMEIGSIIQYSTGVVNILFSGGPGGGWKVSDWQEQ